MNTIDVLRERFDAKTTPGPNGCILWTGALSRHGYAAFKAGDRTVQAHRWIYEMERGPISAGLQIDHLCRVRSCVNPDHLEAVTPSTNTKRGLTPSLSRARAAAISHCPHGHAYDDVNTYRYISAKGYTKRRCRTCLAKRRGRPTPLPPRTYLGVTP